MKKLILVSLLLTACKSAPEGFCECMKVGEELNEITQTVLTGKASEDLKVRMLKIREEKKKACAQFETTAGKEMIEWRKACED